MQKFCSSLIRRNGKRILSDLCFNVDITCGQQFQCRSIRMVWANQGNHPPHTISRCTEMAPLTPDCFFTHLPLTACSQVAMRHVRVPIMPRGTCGSSHKAAPRMRVGVSLFRIRGDVWFVALFVVSWDSWLLSLLSHPATSDIGYRSNVTRMRTKQMT